MHWHAGYLFSGVPTPCAACVSSSAAPITWPIRFHSSSAAGSAAPRSDSWPGQPARAAASPQAPQPGRGVGDRVRAPAVILVPGPVPDAPTAARSGTAKGVERQAVRTRNGIKYVTGIGRPQVGQTPRDVVWKRDKVELWRYHSDRRVWRPPVFIIYSLVSHSYVLDLSPDNTFVGRLLNAGLDVFLIDWGCPMRTTRITRSRPTSTIICRRRSRHCSLRLDLMVSPFWVTAQEVTWPSS